LISLLVLAGLAFRTSHALAGDPCVNPPAGLVSWWKGDGSANDSIGYNHGSAQGGLGFGPGQVGQALNFTAAGQDFFIAPSATLHVAATGPGLTLEGWIFPLNLATQNPIAEWNNGGNIGPSLWVAVDFAGFGGPGSLYGTVFSGTTAGAVASAPNILIAGTWQHVAFAYDAPSGFARLYHNGVEVGARNIGSWSLQTSLPLHLGRRPGGETFSGRLDELSLYNRALSAAEVRSIHLAGAGGKCPISPIPSNVLLSEGFEGVFPASWGVGDADANGVATYWRDVNATFGGEGAHSGSWKGYCAGISYPFGSTEPNPVYQNSMRSYMEQGINYAGYPSAQISFWSKIPSIESCCDRARLWFNAPFSGSFLLWDSGAVEPNWTPVSIVLPPVEPFGTLRFEFSSDFSITSEGWYIDDIVLTGPTTPTADSIASLGLVNSIGAILEADTLSSGPGRDREFINVQAVVRSANAAGGSIAYNLELNYRLLNAAGTPVAIYDSTGVISPDSTYHVTNQVSLSPQTLLEHTGAAALRPVAALDPAAYYTVELRLSRNGALTGVRALSGPYQFFHFFNTAGSDAPLNVLGRLNPVTLERPWAINGSPTQSGFLINATSVVARFDDFDLPATAAPVAVTFDAELINTITGQPVPLRNSRTVLNLSLPSHDGAERPAPVAQTNVLALSLEPAAQLNSVDGVYQFRITQTHNDGAGPVIDGVSTTPPGRLYHFNGRLFFSAFEATFNSLEAVPGLNSVVSPDHDVISFRISPGAGRLPGAPQHSFGDGTARTAWLFVNGDTLMDTGQSYPVTGPIPDQAVIQGICFVRTNIVLFDNGPRAPIQLKFPTGFSIGLSTELRVTIGHLGLGTKVLNAALEPVDRLQTFNAPVFGVEETKPFWIGAPRLEWWLNDGRIVLPSPTQYFYTRQVEDAALEAARPALTRPDDADRISNDGYYRGAHLGSGDVVIVADPNGSALMTANLFLSGPEFRPHLPYTSRATAGHIPMAGGQLFIVNDLIDPATSQMNVAGPVPVPYKRDCLETNCNPAGIAPARLNFSAVGNVLRFTRDGGLLANGTVPETNLTWGYVDNNGPNNTPRFAQQAGVVRDGAFHMAGTFLRGDQSALAPEIRPAVLLLTGVGQGNDVNYLERPGDEPGYRLGLANYAGVNFRAPATGRSLLGGQDTGPFPLTANAKYYARFGGVSGLHQAASLPNPNLRISGYPFTFAAYRLSYLDSEVWESLTQGRLTLPLPSGFFVDFEKMRFTCRGALESAALPAGTGEKKMEYWETWIQPLSLEFRPSALDLCDPAKRYLVLGVQTQLPLIPNAFQAALAFKTNGNLAVTADKILGVDSRFPVPGQISLEAGASRYRVSTAGDGYFNNPETPGAPARGFFNLAGRADVFWFEDIKLHLHVTPQPNSRTEARVDVMGGWRSSDNGGKDVGWTDGTANYFTASKFDSTHRGFPNRAGLTLDGYRNSATEAWRPRAQREWLELVRFDYPLQWDRAAGAFKSFSEAEVVLPVIDVDSRLKTLTAGRADIDFSQDVSIGLPQLKLLDFATDEFNKPLNSLSNAVYLELTDLAQKTGINGGFRALQRTLRESAEDFFRPILEPTLDQAVDRLYPILANALRTDAANFLINVSNQVAGAGANLEDAVRRLNGASNDVHSVIGQLSSVLRDVDDTLQLFIRILAKDPTTQKRNLVGKIIVKVAGDQAGDLGLAIGALTQDLATDLLGQLEPTLARIQSELEKVQGKLADVRTQLGAATGQLNSALGAVSNNGKAIGDYVGLAGSAVSNLMYSVVTPAGDYFSADPERAKREIRERLLVAFLSAGISSKYQQTFRNFLADENFLINELMETLFQQVNVSIRQALEDQLGSAQDGVFKGMKGPAFLSQSLLAAKIKGAPEFNGDSMRKIRLDADVQLNIPNEMKFAAFLQVLELDSASAPAGCIPAGGPAAEVTLGALNVPLGWSGFDNGQTANITARWNIQNKSVYGIGGRFDLGGTTKVKGANISGFSAQFAVGSTEAYLAARAAGESKGIRGEVGFFAGKSCSPDPFKMIDPEMNQVLQGDPLAFRGIYVQYGGRFPLTQLIGIPPSCLLRADGWANNAIYYDWSVPPVGRLGGRQKVGLDVELLCVLGGSISWAVFASVSGQEIILGGQGEVCGKIGVCPFCIEGCAGLKVTGVLNDGGVDYDVDY
jgi:hypothetical protein